MCKPCVFNTPRHVSRSFITMFRKLIDKKKTFSPVHGKTENRRYDFELSRRECVIVTLL